MKQLSISRIKTTVKEVVVRLNKVLIIKGGSGIGKSEGVNQACDELDDPKVLMELLGKNTPYTGVILTEVRLSQYDGVDLRGFPGIDKRKATSIWYPPGTLPFIGNDDFPDDKIIIVFFDEAPDAKADVFAVTQQLVLNRCVGEHVLKPNVRIVMAGNRDIDQSLAKKFPFPLNNRLVHVEAVNTVEEFCAYAQSQGVPPVFLAYWNFRKEMVNTFDPKKVQTIVATNRTWFTVVELYVDKRLDRYPDIKEAAIIGSVGEGPAVDFFAFAEVWQSLPTIDKIIVKPDTYPVPEELSIRYATGMHVSSEMTLENVDKLHIYLCRFPAEIVVMAWSLATARDATLYDADSYLDYCRRFREVYQSN